MSPDNISEEFAFMSITEKNKCYVQSSMQWGPTELMGDKLYIMFRYVRYHAYQFVEMHSSYLDFCILQVSCIKFVHFYFLSVDIGRKR